jgi:hypothetical protein
MNDLRESRKKALNLVITLADFKKHGENTYDATRKDVIAGPALRYFGDDAFEVIDAVTALDWVIDEAREILGREDRFDEAVDDATHAVIGHFEYLGLPDGEQLSDLMVRVNDALTALFSEWK